MKKKLTIAVGVAFLMWGCRKENLLDCVTSNGPEQVQPRETGKFHNLVVYDKFDVFIRQGPEYRLEIKCGGNLLKNIVTRNENGNLYIENKNTCNFVRGYKKNIEVYITCPEIARAENSSVGTMWFEDGFTQDTIVLRAESSGDIHLSGRFKQVRASSHGNGDMYFKGSCNSFYVYTYGINYVHGEELEVTDYAFIDTYSIGDCFVNGTKLHTLEFNLWESGNIYYTGNPGSVKEFTDGSSEGDAIHY